jgi:acetolactate synthase-1/2/3 large subunit
MKTTKNVMNGAQIFLECLRKENVEYIFGYPGGAVLKIYEELYNCEKPRHILVRHEQGAVHMAEGYAKASGKVGVVLVTSGPGATNTVTGIADAYMDSVPIVVFTGQVPSGLIGKDAFQEADIVGITRPITKHNYQVLDVKDLAATIKAAFHIASTGRPGPVLVDLPKDVINSTCEFKYPEIIELKGYKPNYIGNANQIKKAAEKIKNSKKPLLYVGGGVIMSGGTRELRLLAKEHKLPVAMTLHGLGAFPGTDELSLGMLGMHGTYWANKAISECDLLVALGARFDDRVTGRIDMFSKKSYKIHVDIDPAVIDKNVYVDLPIVGDVKHVVASIAAEMNSSPDVDDWWKQINEWKKECPMNYDTADGQLRTEYVIEQLSNYTKGNSIVVTDVGQHQMWTAQYYKFTKPRSLITSGGLGTMGFGLPAGIGAYFSRPNDSIIVITGDGGFQMNIQELVTAVYNKIPLKIFIINNSYLGMVRQWQELFHGEKYSFTDLSDSNPDFVKVAEAFGCAAVRVSSISEFDNVLDEVFKVNDKPVVVDCQVVKADLVMPMVPAGGAVDKMLVRRLASKE